MCATSTTVLVVVLLVCPTLCYDAGADADDDGAMSAMLLSRHDCLHGRSGCRCRRTDRSASSSPSP